MDESKERVYFVSKYSSVSSKITLVARKRTEMDVKKKEPKKRQHPNHCLASPKPSSYKSTTVAPTEKVVSTSAKEAKIKQDYRKIHKLKKAESVIITPNKEDEDSRPRKKSSVTRTPIRSYYAHAHTKCPTSTNTPTQQSTDSQIRNKVKHEDFLNTSSMKGQSNICVSQSSHLLHLNIPPLPRRCYSSLEIPGLPKQIVSATTQNRPTTDSSHLPNPNSSLNHRQDVHPDVQVKIRLNNNPNTNGRKRKPSDTNCEPQNKPILPANEEGTVKKAEQNGTRKHQQHPLDSNVHSPLSRPTRSTVKTEVSLNSAAKGPTNSEPKKSHLSLTVVTRVNSTKDALPCPSKQSHIKLNKLKSTKNYTHHQAFLKSGNDNRVGRVLSSPQEQTEVETRLGKASLQKNTNSFCPDSVSASFPHPLEVSNDNVPSTLPCPPTLTPIIGNSVVFDAISGKVTLPSNNTSGGEEQFESFELEVPDMDDSTLKSSKSLLRGNSTQDKTPLAMNTPTPGSSKEKTDTWISLPFSCLKPSWYNHRRRDRHKTQQNHIASSKSDTSPTAKGNMQLLMVKLPANDSYEKRKYTSPRKSATTLKRKRVKSTSFLLSMNQQDLPYTPKGRILIENKTYSLREKKTKTFKSKSAAVSKEDHSSSDSSETSQDSEQSASTLASPKDNQSDLLFNLPSSEIIFRDYEDLCFDNWSQIDVNAQSDNESDLPYYDNVFTANGDSVESEDVTASMKSVPRDPSDYSSEVSSDEGLDYNDDYKEAEIINDNESVDKHEDVVEKNAEVLSENHNQDLQRINNNEKSAQSNDGSGSNIPEHVKDAEQPLMENLPGPQVSQLDANTIFPGSPPIQNEKDDDSQEESYNSEDEFYIKEEIDLEDSFSDPDADPSSLLDNTTRRRRNRKRIWGDLVNPDICDEDTTMLNMRNPDFDLGAAAIEQESLELKDTDLAEVCETNSKEADSFPWRKQFAQDPDSNALEGTTPVTLNKETSSNADEIKELDNPSGFEAFEGTLQKDFVDKGFSIATANGVDDSKTDRCLNNETPDTVSTSTSVTALHPNAADSPRITVTPEDYEICNEHEKQEGKEVEDINKPDTSNCLSQETSQNVDAKITQADLMETQASSQELTNTAELPAKLIAEAPVSSNIKIPESGITEDKSEEGKSADETSTSVIPAIHNQVACDTHAEKVVESSKTDEHEKSPNSLPEAKKDTIPQAQPSDLETTAKSSTSTWFEDISSEEEALIDNNPALNTASALPELWYIPVIECEADRLTHRGEKANEQISPESQTTDAQLHQQHALENFNESNELNNSIQFQVANPRQSEFRNFLNMNTSFSTDNSTTAPQIPPNPITSDMNDYSEDISSLDYERHFLHSRSGYHFLCDTDEFLSPQTDNQEKSQELTVTPTISKTILKSSTQIPSPSPSPIEDSDTLGDYLSSLPKLFKLGLFYDFWVLCNCLVCCRWYTCPRDASRCLKSHGFRRCWICNERWVFMNSRKRVNNFSYHNSERHKFRSPQRTTRCPYCPERIPVSIDFRRHIEQVHFQIPVHKLSAESDEINGSKDHSSPAGVFIDLNLYENSVYEQIDLYLSLLKSKGEDMWFNVLGNSTVKVKTLPGKYRHKRMFFSKSDEVFIECLSNAVLTSAGFLSINFGSSSISSQLSEWANGSKSDKRFPLSFPSATFKPGTRKPPTPQSTKPNVPSSNYSSLTPPGSLPTKRTVSRGSRLFAMNKYRRYDHCQANLHNEPNFSAGETYKSNASTVNSDRPSVDPSLIYETQDPSSNSTTLPEISKTTDISRGVLAMLANLSEIEIQKVTMLSNNLKCVPEYQRSSSSSSLYKSVSPNISRHVVSGQEVAGEFQRSPDATPETITSSFSVDSIIEDLPSNVQELENNVSFTPAIQKEKQSVITTPPLVPLPKVYDPMTNSVLKLPGPSTTTSYLPTLNEKDDPKSPNQGTGSKKKDPSHDSLLDLESLTLLYQKLIELARNQQTIPIMPSGTESVTTSQQDKVETMSAIPAIVNLSHNKEGSQFYQNSRVNSNSAHPPSPKVNQQQPIQQFKPLNLSRTEYSTPQQISDSHVGKHYRRILPAPMMNYDCQEDRILPARYYLIPSNSQLSQTPQRNWNNMEIRRPHDQNHQPTYKSVPMHNYPHPPTPSHASANFLIPPGCRTMDNSVDIPAQFLQHPVHPPTNVNIMEQSQNMEQRTATHHKHPAVHNSYPYHSTDSMHFVNSGRLVHDQNTQRPSMCLRDCHPSSRCQVQTVGQPILAQTNQGGLSSHKSRQHGRKAPRNVDPPRHLEDHNNCRGFNMNSGMHSFPSHPYNNPLNMRSNNSKNPIQRMHSLSQDVPGLSVNSDKIIDGQVFPSNQVYSNTAKIPVENFEPRVRTNGPVGFHTNTGLNHLQPHEKNGYAQLNHHATGNPRSLNPEEYRYYPRFDINNFSFSNAQSAMLSQNTSTDSNVHPSVNSLQDQHVNGEGDSDKRESSSENSVVALIATEDIPTEEVDLTVPIFMDTRVNESNKQISIVDELSFPITNPSLLLNNQIDVIEDNPQHAKENPNPHCLETNSILNDIMTNSNKKGVQNSEELGHHAKKAEDVITSTLPQTSCGPGTILTATAPRALQNKTVIVSKTMHAPNTAVNQEEITVRDELPISTIKESKLLNQINTEKVSSTSKSHQREIIRLLSYPEGQVKSCTLDKVPETRSHSNESEILTRLNKQTSIPVSVIRNLSKERKETDVSNCEQEPISSQSKSMHFCNENTSCSNSGQLKMNDEQFSDLIHPHIPILIPSLNTEKIVIQCQTITRLTNEDVVRNLLYAKLIVAEKVTENDVLFNHRRLSFDICTTKGAVYLIGEICLRMFSYWVAKTNFRKGDMDWSEWGWKALQCDGQNIPISPNSLANQSPNSSVLVVGEREINSCINNYFAQFKIVPSQELDERHFLATLLSKVVAAGFNLRIT